MTSVLSLTGTTALHRRWLIAFAAASAGAGLGRAVVTTYLPVLLERIQDAPGLIGTVALVNAAAGFAVPLIVGITFDRRHRAGEPIGRLFLAAGAAITAGGLLAIGLGAGTSYLVLAIFAAIAYAGLNVITTTHRALVREDFDPEQRGRVTASQEFALLAGGVAGLALGGLLIDQAAWAPFAIAAAAVIVFAAPTLRVVPDDRPVAGSPSVQPPSRGRLQALRVSGVRAFLAAEVLWVLGYAALPTFFVLYAENVLGLQAAAAAAWLAGFGIATAAAVLAAGRIPSAHQLTLLLVALAVMTCGYAWVGLASSVTAAGPALLLTGAGFGVVSTVAFPVFSTLIPDEGVGEYTGVFFSARAVAGAVALPLTGWLIAATGSYRLLFVLATVATAASLLPLLPVVVQRRRGRTA